MSRTHRRSAAALVYDSQSGEAAPRVVAKGYGLVADMIVQRAKEAGLYVHEAPEMVSLLMQVDLDARIPPQLYQAVAELLAWLHGLRVGLKPNRGLALARGMWLMLLLLKCGIRDALGQGCASFVGILA